MPPRSGSGRNRSTGPDERADTVPDQNGTSDGTADVGWVKFTYGINLTRNPAGSVPVGLTTAGLPVGLQMVGRHHDEITVLRTMAAVETLVPMGKPPI